MPELFIGCSGFSYRHWRGRFYPATITPKRWFNYYCTAFSSVELNVTFYRLLRQEIFERWRQESPDWFTFSVKGSRYITHVKKLADPERALARFFDTVLLLGKKLHVILWQLPPAFTCDIPRLQQFFKQLARYPVRNALEFRHASWCCEEVVSLCREYRVAQCMADWPEFIRELPHTADFVYLRRHGHGGSYAGCYSRDELAADAARIRNYLREGRGVYIYFNNDAEAFAPANAGELAHLLGSGLIRSEDDMPGSGC